MNLVRFLSLVVLAGQLTIGAQTVMAQNLRNADQPAEFPPASFQGKQYVDSRGCVYIRAGIDGNVTWVPRVNRSRKQVCGFKPTQVAGASRAPAQPKIDDKVVVITNDNPPAQTAPQVTTRPAARATAAAAAPAVKAPTTRRTAAVQPKPVVRRATTTRRVSAPKTQVRVRRPVAQAQPRVVKQAVPRVVAKSQRKVVRAPIVTQQPRRTATSGCQGVSAVSTRYIRNNSGLPVRCGPQAEAPVTFVEVPESRVPGNAVIVPKHLYKTPTERRQQKVKPPKGYRAAWTDDRLNPNRARGTLNGKRAMDLVWTRTVPRRLIDRTTGRDMTGKTRLFYPFTDERMQNIYLSSKNRMRVEVNKSGEVRLVETLPSPAVISSKSKAPKVTVRKKAKAARVTKSTPKATQRKTKVRSQSAPRGHKYVQVGTFGVSANAKATAAKLQRLGLPVSYGRLKRKGKTLQVVLAGPFSSANQLGVALRKARSAGFRDAFTR